MLPWDKSLLKLNNYQVQSALNHKIFYIHKHSLGPRASKKTECVYTFMVNGQPLKICTINESIVLISMTMDVNSKAPNTI